MAGRKNQIVGAGVTNQVAEDLKCFLVPNTIVRVNCRVEGACSRNIVGPTSLYLP